MTPPMMSRSTAVETYYVRQDGAATELLTMSASEGAASCSSQPAMGNIHWQAQRQPEMMSQCGPPVMDTEVMPGSAYSSSQASSQAIQGGVHAVPQSAAFPLPHHSAYPAERTPTMTPTTNVEQRCSFEGVSVNDTAITCSSTTVLPPWPSTPTAQGSAEMQMASVANEAWTVNGQQTCSANASEVPVLPPLCHLDAYQRSRELSTSEQDVMHAGSLHAGGTTPAATFVPMAVESVRGPPSMVAFMRQAAGSGTCDGGGATSASLGAPTSATVAVPEGPVIVPSTT